ncbi:TetR/AcrR family transcriptional regulator [Kribbella koreensis]|uniref:TetR/AcrR family transcriptional regulator n=1 Tax=Kribbella koreensis TaxID=57909 RepID=A0ABP4AN45_9ACTN
MRVSREQAAENRERVLAVAGRLFRERGFDAVSIADLMGAAGLTHGGFYKQFTSKEALQAEVCARGAADSVAAFDKALSAARQGETGSSSAFAALLDDYLSAKHRDQPGNGCTVAALAGDAGRHGERVQEQLAAGVRGMAEAVHVIRSTAVRSAGDSTDQLDLATLSAMIGAVVLARSVRETDPWLSERILSDTKHRLAQ